MYQYPLYSKLVEQFTGHHCLTHITSYDLNFPVCSFSLNNANAMPTPCQLNANSMPTQCQLNANSMPTQCQWFSCPNDMCYLATYSTRYLLAMLLICFKFQRFIA